MLKEFKTTVEAGKRLRELPGSGFRVAYKEPSWIATLLPHTYHIPLLASLLDREAFRQAAGGDGDGSAATVLALTAVGQSIGDEPFLISQLVRVSFEVKAARALERTLGLGSVGDTTLAKFQRTFDAETRVPRMVAGLRGERGGLHRLLENIGSGDLHPEDLEVHRPRALGTLGLLEYRTWRSRIPAQQARSLDLYNRLIAAARMLFGPPRAKTFDELELEIENVSREQETWIVRLFLPAGRKINDAETRLTALLRCAVAGIACERFRLKNGRFPKSLEELSKELLASIPEDPFTGDPLLFKAGATGLIVYAVGTDLKDNGGNVNTTFKDEPGTDIGFTLLEPKHRRQPPKHDGGQ